MGSVPHLRCAIEIRSCLKLWRATLSEPQRPHPKNGSASLAVGEDHERLCDEAPQREDRAPGGARPSAPALSETQRPPAVALRFLGRKHGSPSSGAETHPGTQGACGLHRGPARPARGRKPRPSPWMPGMHISFFTALNTPALSGPSSGKQRGPLTDASVGGVVIATRTTERRRCSLPPGYAPAMFSRRFPTWNRERSSSSRS